MSVTTPNRDLQLLHPEMKDRVERWIKDCENSGVPIFVTEAYRSQERQNYLYQQWRTRPWPVVTWTLNSNHTKGEAVDIAAVGDVLYPSDFNRWRKVADIAKRYDIDRGYDLWRRDKPHFQLSPDAKNRIPFSDKTVKYIELLDKINSLMWKELDVYSEYEEIREAQQLLADLNTQYDVLLSRKK